MNSRRATSLRKRLQRASIRPSPAAWRLIKQASDRGAGTLTELLDGCRLIRDARGTTFAVTPAEDRMLRLAVASTGGQLESDARLTDALRCAAATIVVAAALLGALIAAARWLLP